MPKKILLADDSITIQKVVELTFSDADYEVTAVNNGARAVQKLSEMRPDIILSDIIMPEKNGYEVCEYVKSHPEFRNIPVVLLTGTFEPFDPDRAEKAGCDAVVTKPFESQSLIHKVEELIAQAQAGSASAAAPAAPPADVVPPCSGVPPLDVVEIRPPCACPPFATLPPCAEVLPLVFVAPPEFDSPPWLAAPPDPVSLFGSSEAAGKRCPHAKTQKSPAITAVRFGMVARMPQRVCNARKSQGFLKLRRSCTTARGGAR
jgi:CheY-like chemotaxis protein